MFEEMSNRINRLEKLTRAESKLVEYFQAVQEYIALQNIYNISEGAGVSTATVTRFLSRLGYEDFHDFKNNIRHELMGSLESSWERYKLSRSQLLEGEGDQWTRYYNLVANDIKAAHGNISSEKMAQAAEIIAHAPGTVYVMGQFNSYVIASLFWQQLSILRPRTIFLNNQTGNLIHQILDAGKNDVLFAVTYERYAHQTTQTVNEFAERSASVIVLSDSEVSPVSKMAIRWVRQTEGWWKD